MRFEGHRTKEWRKKKKARKQKYSANIGVVVMNAICFMLHGPQSMVLATYTSFLDSCWIDTNYPEFSLLSDLHNVKDIQDLNCLDFQEMEGVEARATRSSN